MSNLNENTDEEEPEVKNPKLWGIIYLLLGIAGLIYSGYLLANCNQIVPFIGAATGGVLLGALSIFLIVFGYRVIKKDY
jgi:hypothetical protein